MSEPSHGPPLLITRHDVRMGPPHEGELVEGVMLLTDRGTIPAILHASPEAQHAVLWVCGARGGFGGPGQGTYTRLAEGLCQEQIASLRLSYRSPNVLHECILDVLAGVTSLQHRGTAPVVLVGRSCGVAVVIAAGAVHAQVAGVVACAPPTYGVPMAGQVSRRPLLVVHGKADTRLPYACGVHIDDWAQEPQPLVLDDSAEHRLDECAAALTQLLTQWIPTTLRSAGPSEQERLSC